MIMTYPRFMKVLILVLVDDGLGGRGVLRLRLLQIGS